MYINEYKNINFQYGKYFMYIGEKVNAIFSPVN